MKVLVLGDGGLAREIVQLVLPATATLLSRDDESMGLAGQGFVVIGVGDPRIRGAIAKRYAVTLADRWLPSFYGPGVLVQRGARLTCDVTLGPHVLINLNATVGHDVTIGACSVVNPGANVSGRVRIGERVLVGAGASIRQGVTVGDDAIVGMGAVVLRDVPAGETWVGNPARRLR